MPGFRTSLLWLGLLVVSACSDEKPAQAEGVNEGRSTGGAAGGATAAGLDGASEVTSSSDTSASSSTSALVAAGGAEGGSGGAADCEPESESCNAGAPSVCSDCGTETLGATCDRGDQCLSGVCVNLACAECEPGVLDCAGLVPRQCSATGRYLRGAACSGDTPRCQDGQCVACQDGDTRPCADCSGIETCRANVFGACQSITPPSCTDTPDCHGSSCCQALFVEGGTYYFGPLLSYATSVTNFCLDQYEVTVGRFREFVSVYDTWLPEEAAGEHQPGAGTGWQSTWTKGGDLPVDAQTLAASLDCGEHPTWRATPGNAEAENLPQNCLTWHEAFAFCIWDGGRLATEAEWEYAAGGGAEERTYPWGDQVPDASQASFDCCADGDCTSCSDADLRPVGGVPAGNGRWGQSDLAGNVYEWVLDGHTAIDFRPSPCIDCAMTPSGSSGVQRGGGYLGDALSLQVVARPVAPRTTRSDALGVRCVRKR